MTDNPQFGQESEVEHSERSPAQAPRFQSRKGIASAVLAIVVVSAWGIDRYLGARELALQIARVRDRGEPLSSVELNDAYQPVPNRPNVTQELLVALAPCLQAQKNLADATLPVIGTGEDPPGPPQEWNQLEPSEDYLRPLAEPVNSLLALAGRDGTARFPVDFSLGAAAPIDDHLQLILAGTRVLRLQFLVHLHRRRIPEAQNCVVAMIALGRTLDVEPSLISQVLRISKINTVAMASVDDLLQHARLAEADIARLRDAIRKIEYLPGLKAALLGERTTAYMVAIAPQVFADLESLTPAAVREIDVHATPRHARGAAKILELSLRIDEALDESLGAALSASDQVEEETFDLLKGIYHRWTYHTLSLNTSFSQPIRAFRRSSTRRDCLDVALAVELFRQRKGTWPTGLEQLVPDYLSAVPIDPYDDKPLKFVSTDEIFKVYTVGEDRRDNGGQLSMGQERGTDMGFQLHMPDRETR
ncbi:MAG: hypothetical protein JSS02_23345 [Planctomycetes bacterium]|nr:hypothetical protein [Planctomycetota bacterium]